MLFNLLQREKCLAVQRLVFRTAEALARFLQPLLLVRELKKDDPVEWLSSVTTSMATNSSESYRSHRSNEEVTFTSNSDRIYFEQLHIHPFRLSLTFSQEWMEWGQATDGLVIFQFIRSLARLVFINL